MANTNVKGTGSKIVSVIRMWSGSNNTDNTSWLQAPIGSNAPTGGLQMLVVDVVVGSHNSATVFDLADKNGAVDNNAITGADGLGGSVLSVLSVVNTTQNDHPPTEVGHAAARVLFKTANDASVADDVHRITLLYYGPSA